MSTPTLIQLLEAGVHFGHKKERSHPQSRQFIFSLREGIYVIDLEKTISYLENALVFLKKEYLLGKTILFVGTKRQAKEQVQKLAESIGMPYINKRFLGGTLTNFETIKKNILQLEKLEAQIKTPEFQELTKKEKKIITDKLEKLQATFNGVKEMKNLPDVLFVVDANRELLSIHEAQKMNIPVVAICDTDANPQGIDYPVPANDDAPKAIAIILNFIKEALTNKDQGPRDKVQEDNKEISKPKKPTTKKSASAKVTAKQGK